MTPRTLKEGDGLSLDYFNGTAAEIGRGRLKVDPRTGLQLLVTPWACLLRAVFPPSGWYRVTGAGSAPGSYALQELVDELDGAWSDGPGTVDVAWEVNDNAVPDGAVAWARKRRGSWRFQFGGCPS